jgi:hypothetical protein
MRDGLEIKLIISLHNSSGLISPKRSVCGNGVFNLTDTVLPAYFPPQRRAILGSISEQSNRGLSNATKGSFWIFFLSLSFKKQSFIVKRVTR